MPFFELHNWLLDVSVTKPDIMKLDPRISAGMVRKKQFCFIGIGNLEENRAEVMPRCHPCHLLEKSFLKSKLIQKKSTPKDGAGERRWSEVGFDPDLSLTSCCVSNHLYPVKLWLC
jgi:hypothetical protein